MGSSSPSRLPAPDYKTITKKNKLGEEKELIEIDKEIFDFRIKDSKLLNEENTSKYENKIEELSKIKNENVIEYKRTFKEKIEFLVFLF